MDNREQLELDIKRLEDEADYFRRRGNVEMCETRMVEAMEKREELEQLTRSAVIAEVQSSESSFGISIGGETVNFREVTASEEAYQALTIAVRLKFAEYEQQNQEEIKALKASYESDIRQMELQVTNVNAHNKALEEENSDLKNEIVTINLVAGQAEAALENARLDAEAYKAQVADLRNQVSKPAEVTNMDSNALSEAMEKLRASKPAIYNVVEINGTKSTAISVDSNETIEFHPNYIGKYRIVSHDEAMQMRAVMESEKADVPESAAAVEEVIESPTITSPEIPFRNSDTTVQEHTVHREVDAEGTGEIPTSTQEAAEATLEERVTMLEMKYKGLAETVYRVREEAA